jgi:hypothetical protein
MRSPIVSRVVTYQFERGATLSAKSLVTRRTPRTKVRCVIDMACVGRFRVLLPFAVLSPSTKYETPMYKYARITAGDHESAGKYESIDEHDEASNTEAGHNA